MEELVLSSNALISMASFKHTWRVTCIICGVDSSFETETGKSIEWAAHLICDDCRMKLKELLGIA